MIEATPLATEVVVRLGPVPITRPVVTTWAIMAVVVAVAWLGMRRRRVHARPLQAALEVVVEAIVAQIAAVTRRDGWQFVGLLGTLFIFLVCANLSAVLPGVHPPTARIETPAALALIVFFSVHYYGIRARGWLGYVRRYTRPSPFLLPLNVLSELTRTFSLMVRLFGNMMSHELVIAIVLSMAGLFVPVPFMALGVLIGIIQAYIFTVLATVFIGAAISGSEA